MAMYPATPMEIIPTLTGLEFPRIDDFLGMTLHHMAGCFISDQTNYFIL